MVEAVVSTKPLVSIVVTSYNHAEYLDKRMQSLLAQTYDNIEINVVDDCSTDNSAEVLANYASNPKVKITLLHENQGYANASNIGVDLSRGDYIMFAECDDFSEPSQIEKLINALLLNANAGVAFCQSNMVDENGIIFGTDFEYREKLFQELCSGDVLIPQKMAHKFFLRSCVIPNMSAAIIRKKYYDLAGGFDSRYKACADWDFWCRIVNLCDFYYVAKPLNNFRSHQTTVRNTSGIQTSTLEIFDILYNSCSRMKLTYSEKLKFKLAIGAIWGSQYKQNSLNWFASFPSVWLRSLKYDYFIIFYLLMWIAKRSYEKLFKKDCIAGG